MPVLLTVVEEGFATALQRYRLHAKGRFPATQSEFATGLATVVSATPIGSSHKTEQHCALPL
jgi:hypothetical protein